MLTRNDEMMGARAKSGKASNGNGSWPEHTARIPITYERETLYERVWAEPVRTVAKSYYVSDVYLAKVWRRSWPALHHLVHPAGTAGADGPIGC